MDRRMYRGNMGNMGNGCNNNMPPYRLNDPVFGDVTGGYMPEDDCGRNMDDYEDGRDIDRFPIGMCYVPWQHFRNIYENEFTALAKGTMFKELDLDWYGRGCK